jgi:hypothetical protein
MLPLLLIGCELLAPAPTPLALSVALPEAQHAGRVPARRFLQPHRRSEISDSETEALCAWLKGSAQDDRIAEKLQARGELRFSLLEASAAGIRLGGTPVMSLTDGRVPEDERRGMLISPLYEELLDSTEAQAVLVETCQLPRAEDLMGFSLLLAIDPALPFETVRQILYTAGQARSGSFYVAVDGPAGEPLPPGDPADTDRQLIVTAQADHSLAYSRVTRPDAEPHPGPLPDAMAALLDGDPLGCGLLSPRLDTPWSAVVASFDALSAAGASRFIMAGGEESDAGPTTTPTVPPSTLALSLQAVVPAFFVELPRILPADPDDDPHGGSECSPTVRATADIMPRSISGALQDSLSGMELLDGVNIPELSRPIGAPATSSGRPLGSHALSSSRITLGAHTIDGPLRPEALEAVLERSMSQFQYCYQRELLKKSDLAGELLIRLEIQTDGGVHDVVTVEASITEPVVKCIEGRFRRFQFPRLPGGLTATVTLPMTFAPR